MMDNSVSSGSEDGDGNVQGAKMLRLNNDEDDEKFSSQKQNAKNETVDLLILGLPFDLEEDKLRDYFSEHGRVIFFEVLVLFIHFNHRCLRIFECLCFIRALKCWRCLDQKGSRWKVSWLWIC
jgi:hypothetical protein